MRLPFLSSRWQRKRLLLRLRKLARHEQSILFVLALLIGLAAGYATVGFRELIGLFQWLFYRYREEQSFLSAIRSLPWWHLLLAPALGGLAIGPFVYYVMPGRRNHGVADVIEACGLRGGRMNVRAGIGAALAAAASIGMGASVGREGPAVHIGASIAAWAAARLGLSRSFSLTLVGCGVAAAVAASFNAPIAGVFFALEVVVGQYALHVFTPIVVSSVIATIVTRVYLGEAPAFSIPHYSIVSFFEVPAFVLLGLVCALVATVFVHGTIYTEDRLGAWRVPQWLRPALGGLLVGAIAIAFPQVLGVGYQATDLALTEALSLSLLIALVVAKTVATAIALGSGFAGGVFSPSLFLGAMTGGAFGIIAGDVFPAHASAHGAYTVMGMAGVAAAVLGAPISTILIMFELTSDYGLTIAVMVVATIASLVTHQSFFDRQLERRGIDLVAAREEGLLAALTVEQVISKNYLVVPKDMELQALRQLWVRERPRAVLVVDDREHLCGSLMLADVIRDAAEGDRPYHVAGDVMRPSEAVVLPHASLDEALQLLSARDEDYLPVVDDIVKRHVVGIVRHKDLVLAHNRALLEARRAEHGRR